MGPTWIVVVVEKNGDVSVREFSQEDQARAYFDHDRKVAGRRCYLAPVRAEARS